MSEYIVVKKEAVQQALEPLQNCLKNGEVTLEQYDAERNLMTVLDAAEKVEPVVKQEPICRCDLRTKLVGDGCETCNPAPAVPALTRYNELMEGETEPDPVERLRFLLSLARKGQYWLDVEPVIATSNSPLNVRKRIRATTTLFPPGNGKEK